jgi:hypothetical protein
MNRADALQSQLELEFVRYLGAVRPLNGVDPRGPIDPHRPLLVRPSD